MNAHRRWSLERLGYLLYSRDRHAEARAVFEGLTQLAPDAHFAWYGLGLVARKTDDLSLAADYLRHAQSLRPSEMAVRIARAEVAIKLGDRDAAQEALAGVESSADSRERDRALVLRRKWLR